MHRVIRGGRLRTRKNSLSEHKGATIQMKILYGSGRIAFLFLLVISQIQDRPSLAQEIKEQAVLRGHSQDVSSIEFASDGLALVSGSYDGSIKVWDIRTAIATYTIAEHRNSILAVTLTGDGKTLASGGWDQSVKLWNFKTGKELLTFKPIENPIYALAFSPNSKTLASASWGGERGKLVGRVRLWDVGTGKLSTVLPDQSREVAAVTFSADGKIMAFGSGEEISLWDVIERREIRVLKGHTQVIRSLVFTPDAKTLVSGSGDFEQLHNTRAEIKVWDVATGKECGKVNAPFAPACVAIDPTGKVFASGGFYDPVKLWDLSTLKELASVKIEGNRLVNSLAFATNGKILACGCADETIRLLDVSKILETRAKR